MSLEKLEDIIANQCGDSRENLTARKVTSSYMLHLKVIDKFYFPTYTLAVEESVEEFSFMIELAKQLLKNKPFLRLTNC